MFQARFRAEPGDAININVNQQQTSPTCEVFCWYVVVVLFDKARFERGRELIS